MADSTKSRLEQAIKQRLFVQPMVLQSVLNAGSREYATAGEQSRNWLMPTMPAAKSEDEHVRH